MNNLSLQNKTMSSIEIAELTGKRHTDVISDIKNVLEQAGIENANFSAPFKMPSGQRTKAYNLPRRECDLVVSGYSVKYRLKIIDRWQELESLNEKTELEMLLITVQKAVAHERDIKELQHQQKETTAQVTALVEGENYFTIVGYANVIGKKVDTKTASSIGKKATKLCKSEDWTIGAATHPVFGRCNTYPREALEQVFMDKSQAIDFDGEAS